MNMDLIISMISLLLAGVSVAYTAWRHRNEDHGSTLDKIRTDLDRTVRDIGNIQEKEREKIGVLTAEVSRMSGADLSSRVTRLERDVQGVGRQAVAAATELRGIHDALTEIRREIRGET